MKDFEGYREAVGSRGLQGSVCRRKGLQSWGFVQWTGPTRGNMSGVLEGSRIEVRTGTKA